MTSWATGTWPWPPTTGARATCSARSQKTGYADFWELYKRNNLPGETKNYVPEILAAIIIANHPQQYGFDDVTLDPPVLTDTVTINYSVDLRLVSDLVDAPVDELMALNPSLLRMVTPPDDIVRSAPARRRGHTLRAAHRRDSRAKARRLALPSRCCRRHAGLSRPRRSTIPLPELAAANQLGESDSLSGVEALVVPVAPVAVPSRGLLYTVRRGDTLVSIADRFGVSLSQLRRWNSLTGTRVEPGRRLHVAEPAHLVQSQHEETSRSSANSSLPDPPPSSAKKATTSRKTRSTKSVSNHTGTKSRARKHSAHRNSSARAQK